MINKARIASIVTIVAILAVLGFVVVPLIWGNHNSASGSEPETETPVPVVAKITPEELEQMTLGKYKDISWVLLDSSLSGKDRQRVESTGFSDALTFGFKAKDEAGMFAEVEEEILRNPVYGVTLANALHDKKVGNRTIGYYNPWMKEMVDKNQRNGVSYWLERHGDDETFYVTEEYRCYAATLCTWLEQLVPQGVHAWETTENWPLNGAAKNNDRAGIPADYQYCKDALILAYLGKHQTGAEAGEGMFVMGLNIHDKRPEFYGGTPKNPTPTPTPTNPGGGGNPDNPDNPPTPDNPKKDPSQLTDTNTEPNDNTGPGPDTNNPDDPNHSTADRPDNSSSYSSYDEYRQHMDDLANTNQHQQTGGSGNSPSTGSASGTNVDNNGDEGTGHGGADTPTPTAPSATEADTGESVNGNPGSAWGGPQD